MSVPTETDAAIGFTKLVGGTDDVADDGLGVGDTIVYWFAVTNQGNLTLRDIVIDDPHLAGVTCVRDLLRAGESTMCTGNYTITDIDAATAPC